jgi:hypothetical protein
MSGFGHITLSRCEPCMFGSHFDEPTPHTWMGPEDLEHAGPPQSLMPKADLAKYYPCACTCSGQAGHHVPLTAEQADSIIAAAGAAQPEETQQ